MKKLLVACLFAVCGGASASVSANTSPKPGLTELIGKEFSLRFCDDCVYAYPAKSLKDVDVSVKFDCEKDGKKFFVPSSDIFTSLVESEKADAKTSERCLSASSAKTKDNSFGEDADVEFRFGSNFRFGVQLNGWKVGEILLDTDRLSITASSKLCIGSMNFYRWSHDATFISVNGSIEIARFGSTYSNDIFVYGGHRLSVCDARNLETLVDARWFGTSKLDRLAVLDNLEKMKEGDDSAFDNWFFSISRRGCGNKDGSKWVEKRIGKLMFGSLVCDELSIDDCSSTLVNSFTKSCFDKSPSSTDEEVVSAEQMKVRIMALVKLKKNFQMLKWRNDVLPDYVKADEFGRLYSDTLFKVEVDRFSPVGYSELEGYANKAYVKVFEEEIKRNKEQARDEASKAYNKNRSFWKKKVEDAEEKVKQIKVENDTLSKELSETKVMLEETKEKLGETEKTSAETKKKLEEELSYANGEVARLKEELDVSNKSRSELEIKLAELIQGVDEEITRLNGLFLQILYKDSFSHSECDNGKAAEFLLNVRRCIRGRTLGLSKVLQSCS